MSIARGMEVAMGRFRAPIQTSAGTTGRGQDAGRGHRRLRPPSYFASRLSLRRRGRARDSSTRRLGFTPLSRQPSNRERGVDGADVLRPVPRVGSRGPAWCAPRSAATSPSATPSGPRWRWARGSAVAEGREPRKHALDGLLLEQVLGGEVREGAQLQLLLAVGGARRRHRAETVRPPKNLFHNARR